MRPKRIHELPAHPGIYVTIQHEQSVKFTGQVVLEIATEGIRGYELVRVDPKNVKIEHLATDKNQEA
jgi:hypothetical protein